MPRRVHSARWIHQETTRHGKTVYFFRREGGRRYRLPDDYGSESFWRAYRLALAGTDPVPYEPKPTPRIAAIERALRRGVTRAKGQCAAKGLAFDLTPEWAIETARAQGWRCAMTGIPFLAEKPSNSHLHPFTPSLDRIIPGGGYTTSNVRVVVFALNSMLSDWGDEVMRAVATGYMFRQNKRGSSIPVRGIPQPRTFQPE